MDHLVTPDPEQGCAQDLAALSVDQHLHKARRLAFFDRARDAAHRASCDQRRLPGFPDLLLSQPGSTERRIDVKRIGINAVADALGVPFDFVPLLPEDIFKVMAGRIAPDDALALPGAR